jgi:DNA-binding NarL/FixJ family response regulator
MDDYCCGGSFLVAGGFSDYLVGPLVTSFNRGVPTEMTWTGPVAPCADAHERTSHMQRLVMEMDSTLTSRRPAEPVLVIANRHEIVGAGIAALLQAGGYGGVVRCLHEDELLRSIEAHRPDIILLAENMVGQNAAKTILRLRAGSRSVAIIFLLEERDAITAADLQDLDVEGLLVSAASARSVIDCVESVRHGRKWLDPSLLRHLAMAEQPSQIASNLTSREADIARRISRGLRNKEIARELHLSEGTVKMHLHHIYEKLHLGGRTQLALSTAGACAPMPVSGNGVRPLEEPACPDSAAAAKILISTSVLPGGANAIEMAVQHQIANAADVVT